MNMTFDEAQDKARGLGYDSFIGEYLSRREAAEAIADSLGICDSEITKAYFDFETFTEDIFNGDYIYLEGFVFSG